MAIKKRGSWMKMEAPDRYRRSGGTVSEWYGIMVVWCMLSGRGSLDVDIGSVGLEPSHVSFERDCEKNPSSILL